MSNNHHPSDDLQMSDPTPNDPRNDADLIRLKRLAKLQQSTQSNQSHSNTNPNTIPNSTSTKSTNRSNPLDKVTSTSQSNFHLAKNPSTTLLQSSSSSLVTSKSNEPSITPAAHSSASSQPLSPEELRKWEDQVITKILKVTLDEALAAQSQWTLVYLLELKNELEEEESGSSSLLSLEITDRILIARLSLDPSSGTDDPILATVLAALPSESSFRYLAHGWVRALEERSKASTSKSSPSEKVRIIEKIKELIVSYIGLVIQDPGMFPNSTQDPSTLGTPELVQIITHPTPSDPLTSLFWSLVHDLAKRFDSDGLEDVIGPALTKIAMDVNLQSSKWHLGGHEWRTPVRIIEEFVEVKPIARMITNLPSWLTINESPDSGRWIEFFWLLGPIMALSTFPDRVPAIASEYFKNPKERPRDDLDSTTKGLQGTLNSLQLRLYTIFDRIVRSGPSPREAVLSLWAKIIQLNNKRAAIQVDRSTVASDGMMINTQAVLLQFAAPFLDVQCTKIDKVDSLYFKRSNRLDIRDETKINASKQESDEFFDALEATDANSPNFISEIFFLNVAIFRLGILTIAKNWDKKAREIDDMKKELERAEGDRRWDGTPQEAIRKASLEKFKNEISSLKAKLVAYEVQMCDPEFLTKCNSFCSFVMTWCVRIVDPLRQHPRVQIKLPLPKDCPLEFRMLPEYILEDVIEFYSFVSRHLPIILLQTPTVIDELLAFTLVFLTTPYLKNYHLKSKFIEILYFNTVPIPGRNNGILGDSLNFHPLALAHLMPALMQIYIEVEITGSHTQFYDKFYSRRYIALILRKIWDNQTHRAALKKQSTTESFIRFANLLMNDVTYLLDDTLGQLQEVHRIETKMADQSAWMALPESERKEEESKLLSCERHCPSFLSLANENVNMLKIFTEETPDAFLKSEIVNRLAAMLDYNLNTLAGPKCQTLKIKDPKKYHFQPKTLLSDLLQVYLNLWDRFPFQEAISNDGRSYNKELFERADRIAKKANLKSPEELQNLTALVRKVEELRQLGAEEEEELGEVPDEFLDPLMATLMKEPVILPTSKTTVDLSTIKQHFLSDATDPFNRMPLKIEDVVPDVDLQAKITAWVQEKKAQRMQL